MAKNLLEMTADIVKAQAVNNEMSTKEITEMLRTVFSTLQDIKKFEDDGRMISLVGEAPSRQEELQVKPFVSNVVVRKSNPMKSIKENSVECLECGTILKTLAIHIVRAHNISAREYKLKWGIPLRQSLSAKSTTRLRSEIMTRKKKEAELPKNLSQFLERQRGDETSRKTSIVETASVKDQNNRVQIKRRRKVVS